MKTVGLENVTLSGRPVVISDVDDVVLQFISPFQAFLEAQSLHFLPRSFRLSGNIVHSETNAPVDDKAIRELLDGFFEAQESWQTPFDHSIAALKGLADSADIIFLTAMPPAYFGRRRALLDTLGLHYPLVATLEAKGPVAAKIMDGTGAKTAFLDDMAHNITSVGQHLPDCLLLHMPPDSEVHTMAPRADGNAVKVKSWPEARAHIQTHFHG